MLTLDKFISVCHNLYVIITQCAKHVDYQIPQKLTGVNFLIDDIECKYSVLNVAIVMVKFDKGPTGKVNKSEDAAAYFTPWYPVANDLNTNRKRGAYEISHISDGGAQVS